jgi:uncharacterized protein (TIGR03437 family)
MRVLPGIACLPLAVALATAQTSSFQPTFQATTFPTGCPAVDFNDQIIQGDFNGDHKPDLAIVCDSGTQISVLLGDGTGGFKAPVVTAVPAGISGNLVAADLNGDGKTDLLFTQNGLSTSAPICGSIGSSVAGASLTATTLLSKGDGTFGSPFELPTSLLYASWGAADLNGDGIPDLLLSESNSTIGFMLGHKDGTLSPLTAISAPGAQCYVNGFQAVADFNNDGKPDLLVLSTDYSTGQSLQLLVNQGDAVFAANTVIGSNVNSALLAADFNGDGILDLLVSLVGPDGVSLLDSALLGKGGGTFGAPIAGPAVFGSTLFSLDLNGDGKADMVQAAGTAGLAFYLSNGDGTFTRLPVLTSVAGFLPNVVTDFNADGKPDLAGFVGSTHDTVEILINTTSIASVSGALNGASFAKGVGVTPGSLISVFGTGFASANALAQSIPLPLSLGNVSATVGGIPAPLQFVSSGQINLQVPWEITSSTADIVVTANGNVFPAFQANIAPVAPGIFSTQFGTGQAIAINPDGSLAGPENSIPGLAVRPAKIGDVLEILATGLGAVSPAVADGADTSDGLRQTAITPVVLIGSVQATVSFSGLAPQFVGVNQLNVTVPQVAPGVVPLQIQAGGITTSDQVTIAVSQ